MSNDIPFSEAVEIFKNLPRYSNCCRVLPLDGEIQWDESQCLALGICSKCEEPAVFFLEDDFE